MHWAKEGLGLLPPQALAHHVCPPGPGSCLGQVLCSPASPRSSGTSPALPGSSADAQALPVLGGKKGHEFIISASSKAACVADSVLSTKDQERNTCSPRGPNLLGKTSNHHCKCSNGGITGTVTNSAWPDREGLFKVAQELSLE